MELDLQSLFGLHVHSCTHSCAHLGSYTRTLLVSQDRRHLFAPADKCGILLVLRLSTSVRNGLLVSTPV
jgi:hypothetical protein